MQASPEARQVDAFIAGARRRLVALRAVEGAAAGAVVGALAIATGAAAPVAAPIVLVGILTRAALGDRWQPGWWRSPVRIAIRAEQRAPTCRNLLVTATELVNESSGTSPRVRHLVVQRAAALAGTLDQRMLFPSGRPLAALGLGVLLLVASLIRPVGTTDRLPLTGTPGGPPAVRRVEVTIIPPAYSGSQRVTLVNPARIEAMASSRIAMRIEAAATSIGIETLSGTRTLSARDGTFGLDLDAETDGFIAVTLLDSARSPGARRLIGLSVTPDRPPRVRLTSPGRDLFFAAVPDSLPVLIEADDDLGLASIRLRYTAVSGSGERFTFTEQDVPLRVSTDSPRSWRARGAWHLDQLQLAPGDLVVYRAIASDRRPGAPPVVSESYVIEVVTPGAIAAEGFAADDRRDRYAVSQQMVILKTERLIAGRAGMTADSVRDAARLLAAEQRQVRAEFVFMMGGELEDAALETAGTLELDETAEAEAEGDLLAGRLQNQGRIDMMRAIRAMSMASASLTAVELDESLRLERAALENLMRAFARSRFILRALSQRERIDLSRRLSGVFASATGITTSPVVPAPGARTAALRRLLGEVAAVRGDAASTGMDRAEEAAIAMLRADPASDAFRGLATRVQELADLPAGAVAARVDSLVSELVVLIGRDLPAASRVDPAVDAGAFEGAWRDAMLRAGPRR